MKKQITFLGILVMLLAAFTFSVATAQQDKNNNKKGQQQKPAKAQPGDKPGKPNAVKDNPGQQPRNANANNKGNDNKNNKPGNAGNNNANDDKPGRNDMAKGNNPMKDGYKWDRETFKDRKNYRKQDKVTLCHKFNQGDEPGVTIRVSANAVNAHLKHGDVMGDCPAVNNSRYSNIFLRNRADYYNLAQDHYEQVSYSRSILDYALQRLSGSRQQLVVMQNSNVPLADIERKQATIVELEQNVSLLETLVGAAAGLVVNKLLY